MKKRKANGSRKGKPSAGQCSEARLKKCSWNERRGEGTKSPRKSGDRKERHVHGKKDLSPRDAGSGLI